MHRLPIVPGLIMDDEAVSMLITPRIASRQRRYRRVGSAVFMPLPRNNVRYTAEAYSNPVLETG